MAVGPRTDAQLTLAGVDLSDHCDNVMVVEEGDAPDISAFGSQWEAKAAGGKKRFVLTCSLRPDQDASEVSATLEGLVNTVVAFTAKEASTATSATNRQWSGNIILTRFEHLNASYGVAQNISYTWPGTGALTTATS